MPPRKAAAPARRGSGGAALKRPAAPAAGGSVLKRPAARASTGAAAKRPAAAPAAAAPKRAASRKGGPAAKRAAPKSRGEAAKRAAPKRAAPKSRREAAKRAAPKRAAPKSRGEAAKRAAPKRAAPKSREPAAKRARTGKGNALGLPEIAKYPTVFEFTTESKDGAFGLFVDETRCMMGDETGLVADVDRETGEPTRTFRLPDGVKCIVGDGEYLYVGTNGGEIFDLTGGRPRLVAKVEGFGKLLWMDISGGRIAAADSQGNVGLLDCEGEVIWKVQAPEPNKEGWMCRMDNSGIYYGANGGVRKYDLRGNEVWAAAPYLDVAFGLQTPEHVWAIGLVSIQYSPQRALIVKIAKESGEVQAMIQTTGTDCCCVSPDLSRAYDGELCCQPTVGRGAFPHSIPWKGAAWVKAEVGMALSSQQSVGERIYATGWVQNRSSSFACYDVSAEAIAAQAAGSKLRKSSSRVWQEGDRQREEAVDQGQETQEAASAEGKVVVLCVSEGGKVRARVESKGYDPSLNCQFPRALREDGARFVVDAVDLAPSGDFYRCRGEPQRLRG